MAVEYYVAFWNLENLFDVADSPRRSEKLQRALGKDIKGWTQALLDKKIAQLASIIARMNGGQGPDVLGVCEVENKYVMDLLAQRCAVAGRNYAIAHHDTSDHRGIDVGFIYDANLFTAEEQFSHFVMRRTATRDILQVNFRTANNNSIILIGNHWPSRSGGQAESACYRAIAGETLAYFHQRIMEVKGNATAVLAMGDFNDEPFDSSLEDHALSTRGRTNVTNARSPRLLNLMWPIMGRGLGSFYFDNYPNLLDQFLANKPLLQGTEHIKVIPESAEIVRFPGMMSGGKYPTPIPFGGMGKKVNKKGFSDHFPIGVKLRESA